MHDGPIVSVLSLLPRKALSRRMGRWARWSPSRWGVRLFVWAYGVNLDEAEKPLREYHSLDDFFTRRLRPGVRPIDATPGALLSPVDGVLAWAGAAEEGCFEMAPGRPCRLDALLGRPVEARHDVVVLYLSPKDYHRVHAPLALDVRRWRYVPGTLWPVFPAAIRKVDELFARNERVVLEALSGEDAVAVVFVGAFGVGRIEVSGLELPEQAGEGACAVPVVRAAGDELGTFHLGSTIVLVLPEGRAATLPAAGSVVRMGERLDRSEP